MTRRSGSIRTSIAARSRFPVIFAAAWFPGGHQVSVIYIAQHGSNAKSDALANFDVGDIAAAHPDFNRSFSDSEVLGDFSFGHKAVLKGDRLTCRWCSGLVMALNTLVHLAVLPSTEFNACKHILNRTATDQFGTFSVDAESSENQGRNVLEQFVDIPTAWQAGANLGSGCPISHPHGSLPPSRSTEYTS